MLELEVGWVGTRFSDWEKDSRQQSSVTNPPGVTPLLSRPQPDTGWRSPGTGAEPRVWRRGLQSQPSPLLPEEVSAVTDMSSVG